MAGLKIALINGIKPMKGSGDGITEYAYNMYLQLRKKNKVDLIYAIERARKNDALGLIRINSALGKKAEEAAGEDYDIFHIVNQEVGFVAKAIKSVDRTRKVVTTIHDISRFQNGLHAGFMQKAYNEVVKRSIKNAVDYSDFLVFDSAQTMAEVENRFSRMLGQVVSIGIDSRFSAPIRKRTGMFVVGYLGSFAHHKNVMMLIKAANMLKTQNIEFRVYGVGNDYWRVSRYIDAHGLDNVRLMGFADERKKVGIYDGFNVFVFPSLYEGFGLPILEAQARGLPVVIYKHGKISAEVRRHCMGAGSSKQLLEVILKLKKRGYDTSKRAAAISYARSFTWERCAKETFDIYKGLI